MPDLAVNSGTFELEFVNPAHSGNITVVSAASTKVKCDGSWVWKNPLSITITNGSDGAITNATGAGVITAHPLRKPNTEVVKIMAEGDESADILMTGTNPAPPPPTSTYFTKVRIKKAGQTRVKADN